MAKALRCGPYCSEDGQIVKDWIKDYDIEVAVRALGESLCYDSQAKWQKKKDKFLGALTIAGLK